MSARFEIVRTDAEQPWHARFRAANGRIVWTTEQYSRRGAAVNAIQALVNPLSGGLWVRRFSEDYDLFFAGNEKPSDSIEVRDVDERAKP